MDKAKEGCLGCLSVIVLFILALVVIAPAPDPENKAQVEDKAQVEKVASKKTDENVEKAKEEKRIGDPCIYDNLCMRHYWNYDFISPVFTDTFLREYKTAFRTEVERWTHKHAKVGAIEIEGAKLTDAMKTELIEAIDRMAEAISNTTAQPLGDKWMRDLELPPASLWDPSLAGHFMDAYLRALLEKWFREGRISEDTGRSLSVVMGMEYMKLIKREWGIRWRMVRKFGESEYQQYELAKAGLFLSSSRIQEIVDKFWAGRPPDFWVIDPVETDNWFRRHATYP